jgi:hypothetical protein
MKCRKQLCSIGAEVELKSRNSDQFKNDYVALLTINAAQAVLVRLYSTAAIDQLGQVVLGCSANNVPRLPTTCCFALKHRRAPVAEQMALLLTSLCFPSQVI